MTEQSFQSAAETVARIIESEGVNLGWPYPEDSPTPREIIARACEAKAQTVLAGPSPHWWTNHVESVLLPAFEPGLSVESIVDLVLEIAAEQEEANHE